MKEYFIPCKIQVEKKVNTLVKFSKHNKKISKYIYENLLYDDMKIQKVTRIANIKGW